MTTIPVWFLDVMSDHDFGGMDTFSRKYKSQQEWWSYHSLKSACHDYDWIIKPAMTCIQQFVLHDEFLGRIIQITSESKSKV